MERMQFSKAIEAIESAKKIISNGWCKNNWAKDSSGNNVHYFDRGAVEFDMSSAVFLSCEDLRNSERDVVMFAIGATILQEYNAKNIKSTTMIDFNDSCENKEQVLNMLDKITMNLNSALANNS